MIEFHLPNQERIRQIGESLRVRLHIPTRDDVSEYLRPRTPEEHLARNAIGKLEADAGVLAEAIRQLDIARRNLSRLRDNTLLSYQGVGAHDYGVRDSKKVIEAGSIIDQANERLS
jgi:hypothetical protein